MGNKPLFKMSLEKEYKKMSRQLPQIKNQIADIIKFIRHHQKIESELKLQRLYDLEEIMKSVIKYGRLYHFQKKKLKEMGFTIP